MYDIRITGGHNLSHSLRNIIALKAGSRNVCPSLYIYRPQTARYNAVGKSKMHHKIFTLVLGFWLIMAAGCAQRQAVIASTHKLLTEIVIEVKEYVPDGIQTDSRAGKKNYDAVVLKILSPAELAERTLMVATPKTGKNSPWRQIGKNYAADVDRKALDDSLRYKSILQTKQLKINDDR
jgi:hypothetical protein